MKKSNKRKLPLSTVALFVVAIGLLMFSTINGARAALGAYSSTYRSTLEMQHISLTLDENKEEVPEEDFEPGDKFTSKDEGLLTRFQNEKFVLGETYDEVLTVKNKQSKDGNSINTFVRVLVRKYWVDENGDKTTKVDPDLIQLGFNEDDWQIDKDASTKETTVLYYNKLLKAGEESEPFMKTLKVDATVPYQVNVSEADGVVTTVYEYQGLSFILEVDINGIQEHHAEDAILSAWGREVTVSGETLKLK